MTRTFPGVTLHLGDCLEVLPTIEAGSVDAVVTDPPYMIGANSVGNSRSKNGTWADMENSAYWYAAWLDIARSRLKSTGFVAVFGNWRSIPTYTCAFSKIAWQIDSLIVWDKQWIGTSGPKQLRPTYEIVALAGMPDAKISDRSQTDIMRCKWMASNSGKTGHPAEKPTDLISRLIDLLSPPGGTVLDPFIGSGTTAVAAINTGRNCIGIERDNGYFDIACRRVTEALDRTALLNPIVS